MENLHPFKGRFDAARSRALMGGGAVFTWLATGKETGGQFSLFEAKGIPGMEPPPHMHTREDEAFYVLQGELLFTIGGKEIKAAPGDFVFLPRNVRHQFKVLSPSFHVVVGIYPAGLERYFEPLSVPHPSGEIPPVNTSPPPPEAMEMLMKLDEQFGLVTFMD